MADIWDPETLEAWGEAARLWFLETLFTVDTLVQGSLGFTAVVLSWVLARALRPHVAKALARLRLPRHIHRLRDAIPQVLWPVSLVLSLWLVIGVMRQLDEAADPRLLAIFGSLITAWVVIRLGFTFIRNQLAARTLAFLATMLAALNITGLLGPTLQALDSLAIDFGQMRVSLLTVIQAMIMLGILLWGASALSTFLERRISRVPELTPSVQVLIGKLLKVTLLTLAFIVALTSVGIDLSALALFSGALGVGLGFGLQKVVSNLVSGLIILMDRSVKPGDTIELGQTFGWITALGARFTSVVTRDGKEYLIPNEDFITQRVVNWSYSNELVRLEIPFGVSYNSDPHEVRRIASEAAKKPDRVAASPAPICHLTAFGGSSLDFLLRFWIKDPKDGVVNIKGQVLLAVWDAFKEHGIEIPFPHRHLMIDQPIQVERVPG